MNNEKLFNYFYKFVDKIIYDIHCNKIINENLFYCNYFILNTQSLDYYPLTICLGGGGYIQYKNIFDNEGIKYESNIISNDYDISFCIHKSINKDTSSKITIELNKICNKVLEIFKFNNLDNKIFSTDYVINNNRIHYRINCTIPNKHSFHILELSFWLNGKISDNFTINDFKNNNLLLYKNEDVYYYLLPLDLLIKTTLYAIVDFFERRNFNKCIKYLDRLKLIKVINDKYIKIVDSSIIVNKILESYRNKIKRKYKMIHDYPFTLAYDLNDIKNNGIIKCIYKELRKNNRKKINKLILEYKEKCKNEKSYNEKNSEITPINTDE